jgi:hypothetical protein
LFGMTAIDAIIKVLADRRDPTSQDVRRLLTPVQRRYRLCTRSQTPRELLVTLDGELAVADAFAARDINACRIALKQAIGLLDVQSAVAAQDDK